MGKRLKKRRRRGIRGLLFLAIMLMIALVCVSGWQLAVVKPELRHEEDLVQSGALSSDTILEPDSDAEENEAEETEETEPEEVYKDYGSGLRPKTTGTRKSDDFYTVLVLGRDTAEGGGGQTDTMMLCSYDVTNQKATVMSIPRDTMVNVPWDVKKINSVYNYYGGGEKGIQMVYHEISQLVGFEPDYQVVVEWEAVGAIVDAIGGVWFDVPYHMDYHDYVQGLFIEQEPGYRLLTGDDAMQVIRWRQNDNESEYGYQRKNGGIGDSGRMELQQAFLKAMVSQLISIQNIGKIGRIAEVFEQNVQTDLNFQNILWFAQSAWLGRLSVDDVEFLTMPWSGVQVWSRTYKQKLSYVVPQPRTLLNIVNTKLSPYVEEFGMSDLDIMSVTSEGKIRSSTGYLEDKKANNN